MIQGVSGTGTVDTVTVTLTNRKEYTARIIGRDSASDLALLKIEANNLPYVNFGDSTRTRVGDWVIAIGNPYGLGGTVTAGIVSALHRGITGVGAYDRYIQTDASINMGNSGGPMFDLSGNVIGINSALISPTGASVGIGLAIPAELARPVIDSLRRGQRPQRGYLGVGLQPLDENIAASLGLPKDQGEIVRSVVPGEAAARAGIQQGDVIVRVGGQEVNPGPDRVLPDRQHRGRHRACRSTSSATAGARRSPSRSASGRPTSSLPCRRAAGLARAMRPAAPLERPARPRRSA